MDSQRKKGMRRGSESVKKADNGDQDGSKDGKSSSVDTTNCKFCQEVFGNNDDMVECGRCAKWICYECSKLERDEFKVLCKANAMMHWYCLDCNVQAVTAVKKDQSIEDACKHYFDSLSSELEVRLSNKITQVDVDLNLFKQEQKLINEDLVKQIKDMNSNVAADNMLELEEREARKNNVILFDIPECSSEDTNTRIQYDRNKALEVLSEIGIKTDLKRVTRLGKITSRKRPLRITVESPQVVKDIMKASSNLARTEDENLKKVSIKKDMTPLEREHRKKLVVLMKSKQSESDVKKDGAKWVIRNNRVINTQRRPEGMENLEEFVVGRRD